MTKIVQITDCHLGSTKDYKLRGVNTYDRLRVAMKAVINEKPDFIVGSGDLSEDGSLASYEILKSVLTESKIPYFLLPGNHDLPHHLLSVFGNKAQLNAQLSIDNWTFLFLNSVVENQAYGEVNERAMILLKDTLDHAFGKVGIFLHHHPVPISNDFMNRYALKNGDQFIKIIERFDNIKFVAFGHIHQKFAKEIKGIQYLGSPATSLQFKTSDNELIVDNELGAGYRVFHLYEDCFDTRVEILPA